MHPVIFKEEYMGWYLSITCQIIIPNQAQVPPCKEMEYELHARWIQNVVNICYFFIGFDKIIVFYL